MKVKGATLALLMAVNSVGAQGLDARPCDNQDNCPTTQCCGWAQPLVEKEGHEHKICYDPSKTLYTNYNGESYSFVCDPAVEKLNFNAEEYQERFWIDIDKDGPMNIPGYGSSRPWVPPIQKPDSLIEVYDKYQLTSHTTLEHIMQNEVTDWLHGYGSGDSFDFYWYNNAKASGDQLYPTGLNKYFDLHSLPGLTEFAFYWLWCMIQLYVTPYTFNIPVDVWLAYFDGASTQDLWKIFMFYSPYFLLANFGIVPSIVANYFRVEMQDGWGILYN